jgi:uncharacterized protein YbgA (DUF1722 family)
MAQRNGTGMFPREVMNRFPLLPLEEEGRLNDLPLREKLIERVFACPAPFAGPTTVGRRCSNTNPPPAAWSLACRLRTGKFHTAHKLTVMAHSPKHYIEMGRLVADAGRRDWDELIAEYGAVLMEGLSVRSPERSEGMGTRGKHVNVLQHLMGYLKNHLYSEDKQELLGLIEDYRQRLVPLIVLLRLLKHHLGRYPVPEWLHQQVYLHPYPKELMLRNHV